MDYRNDECVKLRDALIAASKEEGPGLPSVSSLATKNLRSISTVPWCNCSFGLLGSSRMDKAPDIQWALSCFTAFHGPPLGHFNVKRLSRIKIRSSVCTAARWVG